MAHTAIDPESEYFPEHQEDERLFNQKIDVLCSLIEEAKGNVVFFTGAGISTSAGIPDFRGPEGAWTLKALGKKRTKPTTDTLRAVPTATHMAILTMLMTGRARYLISQNCDGLHRRSGVPAHAISELHGNGNIEHCEDCSAEYLRDFHCYRLTRGSRDHYTGRHCSYCNGRLLNSTIDFGQNLPEMPLKLAGQYSRRAALHVVLGSSLTVSPACDMPLKTVLKGGKLVIVNLQKTPLTGDATCHIYAKTDAVMSAVFRRMHWGKIPRFHLKRHIEVSWNQPEPGLLQVRGVERGTRGDLIPATLFKVAQMKGQPDALSEEPFVFPCQPGKPPELIRFVTMGNYGEPPIDLRLSAMPGQRSKTYYTLYYDMNGKWSVVSPAKVLHERNLASGHFHSSVVVDGVLTIRSKDKVVKLDGNGGVLEESPVKERRWGQAAAGGLFFGGWDSRAQYAAVTDCYGNETDICVEMSPRALSAACGDLVHGGSTCEGGPYVYHADLFFKGKLVHPRGDIPSARAQHAMAQWNEDVVILFGGCDEARLFSDIYSYNIKNQTWKKLGEIYPPKRVAEAAPFRVRPLQSSINLMPGTDIAVLGTLDGLYTFHLESKELSLALSAKLGSHTAEVTCSDQITVIGAEKMTILQTN